jgi:hypothetical protein
LDQFPDGVFSAQMKRPFLQIQKDRFCRENVSYNSNFCQNRRTEETLKIKRLLKMDSAEVERFPYYDGILDHGVDKLLELFADKPKIHDPRVGVVEGEDSFREYVVSTRQWLAEISLSIDPVRLTTTPHRTVEEVSIKLRGNHPELPVAIVSDLAENGLITAIRIYHSTWPLTGGHIMRSPLLNEDKLIRLEGAPAIYQRGLAAGDRTVVLSAFEPTAVVREPSGGPYTYSGEDHEKIYDIQFANDGGIPLQFCTVTDDGIACVIEYNCWKWGKDDIPPQAGVAVYERSSVSGKLAAARIYDDVTPPESSDSSH